MISVCLATYNGARHVLAQLQSILPQLSLDDELIVSDDGSTDATREIVRGMGDSRIVLVDGPRAGVVRNFEHALRQARGDVIFLCDQDDIWLPGKVQRVMQALGGSDLVVTDCRVVDDALHELHPSFFRLNGSRAGLLRNLVKNGYLGCCMAIRRTVLEAALPFPEGIAMHDWWIGLVAERTGRVRFLDEVLSLYRRHGNNASPAATRSTVPLARRLRWRLDMARHLLARDRQRRAA
jgi:glycosyltransferase involved in cell wall biosynthesis